MGCYRFARPGLLAIDVSSVWAPSAFETVDGSELRGSPVDMVNITLFTGLNTCWVVQDFFHQQYIMVMMMMMMMMWGRSLS